MSFLHPPEGFPDIELEYAAPGGTEAEGGRGMGGGGWRDEAPFV